MRSKAFSTFIFCFLAVQALGQYKLSGTVLSDEDSTFVRQCTVYINEGTKAAITDARGKFIFEDLPNGEHTLHFTSAEFEYLQRNVTISNTNQSIRVILTPRTQTLSEVMVTDAQSSFGFMRMRAVESTGIYEGKKSEVIIRIRDQE